MGAIGAWRTGRYAGSRTSRDVLLKDAAVKTGVEGKKRFRCAIVQAQEVVFGVNDRIVAKEACET